MNKTGCEVRGEAQPGEICSWEAQSKGISQLFYELTLVLRVENIFRAEEFLGATCEFGTEYAQTRQGGFVRHKPPDVLQGGENKDIRALVNRRHRGGGLLVHKANVLQAEFLRELLRSNFLRSTSDKDQGKNAPSFLEFRRSVEQERNSLSRSKLAYME